MLMVASICGGSSVVGEDREEGVRVVQARSPGIFGKELGEPGEGEGRGWL